MRAGADGPARMIVGTAGHIDHGKTTLVRALTGVDTDRLKEEKARGISIELGYAYTPLPNGDVLGFIDVPGHEKLVHTMAAGACGIDFALVVIAADDGVMPQTREHLSILQLLGVAHGALALTKSDRGDAARVARVREARAAEYHRIVDDDERPVRVRHAIAQHDVDARVREERRAAVPRRAPRPIEHDPHVDAAPAAPINRRAHQLREHPLRLPRERRRRERYRAERAEPGQRAREREQHEPRRTPEADPSVQIEARDACAAVAPHARRIGPAAPVQHEPGGDQHEQHDAP